MEYLFTYGTLQDLYVQQSIFGRILDGKIDFLSGFKRLDNAVYEKYPLVVQTQDPEHMVQGKVFEVTTLDLQKADAYETDAYRRKKVKLESGIEAWLYIENSH
ncbi:gamma-glutamylcyclotransferase family protein [Flagellimonas eckloniae]|uniref:gamma-glutamylcyclotransferase family protein n=1 Tax=Flagellimonas eckloniae TaxID=346185 RepID=UPI0006DC3A71|nr:gamma-glutamylcyclotransferase family protein [Allomuricauda eckloniae]